MTEIKTDPVDSKFCADDCPYLDVSLGSSFCLKYGMLLATDHGAKKCHRSGFCRISAQVSHLHEV